jgi:hypothetical protein
LQTTPSIAPSVFVVKALQPHLATTELRYKVVIIFNDLKSPD